MCWQYLRKLDRQFQMQPFYAQQTLTGQLIEKEMLYAGSLQREGRPSSQDKGSEGSKDSHDRENGCGEHRGLTEEVVTFAVGSAGQILDRDSHAGPTVDKRAGLTL